MKRAGLFCLVLGLLASSSLHARPPAPMVRWVETLTQPEWAGRATGAGAQLAHAWLVAELAKLGLQPSGEEGFDVPVDVPFSVTARGALAIGAVQLAHGIEFDAANFSDSGEVSGDALILGFGVSAPRHGWDDYAGIDARGRVVVVTTGLPPSLEGVEDPHLATPAGKAATALAHGAAAVIVVNDPVHHGSGTGQRPDELWGLKPERVLAGIPVVRMPHKVAQRVFPGLASQTPAQAGPPVVLRLEVTRTHVTARSLVARVPGTSGPPVFLTAHYDGLGPGAYDGPPPYTGADDNASGVAVVLETARRLVEKPTSSHTVFIVLHDAEELGWLGAARTAHFLRDRGFVGPVFNLDMVGRLGDNGVRLYGSLCETVRASLATKATCHKADESPSDHMAYARIGFPVLGVSTGRGTHYHASADTRDRLNYTGMFVVADWLEGIARQP